MAKKITTHGFKREGQTVQVNFNLIDDIAPLIILDSTQINLTVADGQNENQAIVFIHNECIKYIQIWYNEWKVQDAESAINTANNSALETFINANLIP